MMPLMDAVIRENAEQQAKASMNRSASSSAPPWADAVAPPRAHSVNGLLEATSSSPDGSHSDATSSSSYIISSSGLIDPPSTRRSSHGDLLMDEMGRDSSPQSTSYDAFETHHSRHSRPHLQHQFHQLKKNNKPNRDPTSHRIIEKRRRDRMNNCLTNLSKLIPSAYLKKGRGRIEKTEIIEMAIRYMKHVEMERRVQKRELMDLQDELMLDKSVGTDEDEQKAISNKLSASDTDGSQNSHLSTTSLMRNFGERYKQGFFDCIAETLRFLAGAEGLTVNDQMKTRMLFHLREYFNRLTDYEQNNAIQTPGANAPRRPVHTVHHSQGPHVTPLIPSEENGADEPLNMTIKRPRVSNGTNACNSSHINSPFSHHNPYQANGSQLRDILEAKDVNVPASIPQEHAAILLKTESTTPGPLLPHSSTPAFAAVNVQQKFSSHIPLSAASLFDKHYANGHPPGATECGSSQSGSTMASILLCAGGGGGRSTSSSNATTTSQYPSSPGSSINSFVIESPPRLHSPPVIPIAGAAPGAGSNPTNGFPVPIFALHPVGLFYVPLTVGSHVLDAAFNASLLMSQEAANALATVSHPITINVNFGFVSALTNGQRQPSLPANMANGRSPAQTVSNAGVILNTAAYASSLRLAAALKH